MEYTPSDVAMGMDVHGSDGEKIGTVGAFAASPEGETFLRVDEGGVLGLGSKHLWIPFPKISRVERGRHVTLSCTKEDADQYASKPDVLQ